LAAYGRWERDEDAFDRDADDDLLTTAARSVGTCPKTREFGS